MMLLIITTMAVAAVMGFSLSLYFFRYQTNLAGTWQWLCGVVGGLILGGTFSILTYIILAPPFELFFTGSGLLIIGLITAFILLGEQRGRV